MSPKTTFAGIACLDLVYVSEGYPAENSKIRSQKTFAQAGGFATNAAIAYALLGGQADLYTCIGDGAFSADIRRLIVEGGVQIHDRAEHGFNPPFSTVVLNSLNGSRSIFSSAKDNQTKLISNGIAILGDQLFIDGFYSGLALPLVAEAKSKSIPVIWDADKWRDDDYEMFIKDLDVVIAGSEFMPPGCFSSEDVFSFFNKRNVSRIAISRGDQSILWQDGSITGAIDITPVETLDTLGAGDILHGAFCYYYHEHDFPVALELAAKIASLSCRFYGTKEWQHHL